MGATRLVPEQVAVGKHSLLLEVVDRVLDGVEDLRRRLRDERTGRLLRLPDDVDLLGVLEGVLELALDAAGESRHAARQFGDVRACRTDR
mgnify:CR=1 FL=1